jgi:hypothetical protein
MGKLFDVDFKKKRLIQKRDNQKPVRKAVTYQTVKDIGLILDKICFLIDSESYKKQVAITLGGIARRLKEELEE